MVPIQSLPYHLIDSALGKHLLLVALLPEQVVKPKTALLISGIVLQCDFPSVEVDRESRISVSLLDLGR